MDEPRPGTIVPTRLLVAAVEAADTFYRLSQSHVDRVLTVDVVDGRIQTVRVVRNPDKLRHL